MRKSLIVGNWKMNGSLEHISTFASACQQASNKASYAEQAEVVICPPAIYLAAAMDAFKASPVALGVQCISEHPNGAFTGDLSAQMVADIGAQYVIIGHSERRLYHQETDQSIARMAQAALNADLKPIICVGESQAQRQQGQTLTVIEQQTKAVIDHLIDTHQNIQSITLAYEPIWAIGTGDTASPEQAQEVHQALRAMLASWCGAGGTKESGIADTIRLLYGGSVNPDNAASLLGQPDIDGALVGGASLNAQSFLSIVSQALN